MDAIEALIGRFPDHAGSIRRLQAQDPTFRAMCEDYGDALRALEHWQKVDNSAHKRAEEADNSAHKRAQEYDRFVTELEDEALAALRAYESK